MFLVLDFVGFPYGHGTAYSTARTAVDYDMLADTTTYRSIFFKVCFAAGGPSVLTAGSKNNYVILMSRI